MKYYLFLVIGIILVLIPLLFLVNKTGNATVEISTQGCCSTSCTLTGSQDDCSGDFFQGQECGEVSECNIGCCVDTEDYCYSNYVKGTCETEGGNFIGSRECGEYDKCLTAPPFPAEQEGYAYSNNDGILATVPSSYSFTRGEKINFTSYLFNDNSIVYLEITSDKYSTNWTMNNNNDGTYSLEWDSSLHPTISELTNITVKNYVNGNEGGMPLSLFISPDYCLPVLFGGEKNILVSRTSSLDYLFPNDVVGFFLKFLKFHGIQNDYSLSKFTQPKTLSSNPCSSDMDLIVQFDNNQDGCIQSGNVVTLNDWFAVKKKSLKPDFMDNFCDYVYTVDSKLKELNESFIPPELEILFPENTFITNESFSSFSFRASDKFNYSLRYVITADSDFNELKWGYMNSSIENNTIPLMSGMHSYFVTVEDLNGNFISDSVNISSPKFAEINFSVPKLYIDAEGNYSFIVWDDDTPLAYGIGNNKSEFKISVTNNASLWVSLYMQDGRKDSTDFFNFTPTSSSSLITGNAVASTFSFFDSSDEGTTTEDGGVIGPDGYAYYPIDDSNLYEPQKLCSLGIDTGARYFPINCINSNFTTNINLDPNFKLFYQENLSYSYNFSYDVEVCGFETFVDVRLRNEFTNISKSIEQKTIDVGYKLIDKNNYFSPVNFNEICVYSSDENNPDICKPFSLPECNDGLDNEGDGMCDFKGCFIDAVWNPSDDGCGSFRDLTESGIPECMDGIDNDNDGLIDEADPACVDSSGTYQKFINDESTETSQCQDGVDNELDGLIDLDDPGCVSLLDDNEADGTTQCQDGIDNDGDGKIDALDNGCYPSLSDFFDGVNYNRLIDEEFADFPICDLKSGFQEESATAVKGSEDYYITYSVYNCNNATLEYSIYLIPPNFDGKNSNMYEIDSGMVGDNENKNNVVNIPISEGNFDKLVFQFGSSIIYEPVISE